MGGVRRGNLTKLARSHGEATRRHETFYVTLWLKKKILRRLRTVFEGKYKVLLVMHGKFKAGIQE